MVVPVNKKIRVITTAQDVIHSWFVPQLGVKQDAIPGFVRDTWFRAEKTGLYYGQCAELCGKEHAYMPIQVKVVTDDEYTAWVQSKQKERQAKTTAPAHVAAQQTQTPVVGAAATKSAETKVDDKVETQQVVLTQKGKLAS